MVPEVWSCDAVDSEGVVERYLAERLTEDELRGFEDHLVTCPVCQERVRLGAAVRSGFDGSEPGRIRGLRTWLGALAAAAIAVFVWLAVSGDPAPAVAELGAVAAAPVYLGVPVRAGRNDRAERAFEAAMAEYTAGRYDAAAAGLAEALELGADTVPAAFFRGASHLLTGDAGTAAADFRRVLADSDSPYAPEAKFYLAKALLRLGDAEAALRQLRELGTEPPPLGPHATALADSIVALQTR